MSFYWLYTYLVVGPSFFDIITSRIDVILNTVEVIRNIWPEIQMSETHHSWKLKYCNYSYTMTQKVFIAMCLPKTPAVKAIQILNKQKLL